MPQAMRADAARNRDRLSQRLPSCSGERGVDVPLDEVARSAGVSIGTLYNHFPNRGALLDAVLPERLAEFDRLATTALADPDAWRGFTGFLDGMFVMQARDRAFNDAISRSPVGAVDRGRRVWACRGVMDAVTERARDAGVLRRDFGPNDLATLVWRCRR